MQGERRETLQDNYNFLCTCPRCLEEEQAEKHKAAKHKNQKMLRLYLDSLKVAAKARRRAQQHMRKLLSNGGPA